MKKLKIILLFSLLLVCSFNNKTIYKNESKIEGVITDYKIDGNKLSLELKAKEKIIGFYYFKTLNEKNEIAKKLVIGRKITLFGSLKEPNENRNFNLFNYKKYLLGKKIYWTFNINKLVFKNKHIAFKYNVKNYLLKRIEKSRNKNYLKLFILGSNDLDYDVKDSYRLNGISHLFAISGMHITLFTTIILFILNKIRKNKYLNFIIVSLFLFIYTFIASFAPSVVRASLLFVFINIKKVLNINISNFRILLLICYLLLLYNIYYIYNSGFLYSFLISGFLIYESQKLNKYNNYFIQIFMISIYSFIISLPITINLNNQVNLLTPFLNVLFVPIISLIIFPFCILNFIFLKLDNLNFLLISILEKFSILFSKIKFLTITLKSINIFFIIFYIILIFFILKKFNYKKIILLILILIIHSNIKLINFNFIITMIDVGQGDSILIELPHNKANILIDTGGKVSFKTLKWKERKKEYNLTESTLIPFFKASGIKKIDYLILTHGDYDHMGEAINLVNNFKIEKVIFNCGTYNNLEKALIKVLKEKNIKYYSCIQKLNIDDSKLYFLQTGEYDNENDNSNVIYTELDGYKFMFMGDAGVKKEKDILDKYNLTNIDILKVGHHGSKTSSSEEFINEINPKYSIISVGKNNRYGHPNKEVLNNLDNSKIYRTDEDGSIMLQIKNNKLKIETCSP